MVENPRYGKSVYVFPQFPYDFATHHLQGEARGNKTQEPSPLTLKAHSITKCAVSCVPLGRGRGNKGKTGGEEKEANTWLESKKISRGSGDDDTNRYF